MARTSPPRSVGTIANHAAPSPLSAAGAGSSRRSGTPRSGQSSGGSPPCGASRGTRRTSSTPAPATAGCLSRCGATSFRNTHPRGITQAGARLGAGRVNPSSRPVCAFTVGDETFVAGDGVGFAPPPPRVLRGEPPQRSPQHPLDLDHRGRAAALGAAGRPTLPAITSGEDDQAGRGQTEPGRGSIHRQLDTLTR